MFKNLFFFGAVIVVFLTGCVRIIDEQDIFLPGMAEGTKFTLSSDRHTGKDIRLFTDNVVNPEIWTFYDASFETGAFSSDAGQIAYRIARNGVLDAPPLVIKCGGNSFDVPSHGDLALYSSLPHGDVLVWDYPGYGNSEGAPSVERLQQAATALLSSLEDFQRIPEQQVIFWGYSLGGFVCSDLAAQYAKNFEKYAPLIIVTSAPSAKTALPYLTPWYMKPFIRPKFAPAIFAFDNVETLRGLTLDILIIGARKDRILPVTLSRRLSEQLRETGHRVTYHEFTDADHFLVEFERSLPDEVSKFLTNSQTAVAN